MAVTNKKKQAATIVKRIAMIYKVCKPRSPTKRRATVVANSKIIMKEIKIEQTIEISKATTKKPVSARSLRGGGTPGSRTNRLIAVMEVFTSQGKR